MKARNPMFDDATVEKMRASIIAIGHQPKVRGGNGQALPAAQARLAMALGWVTEYAVPTKMDRRSGFPTCYKIDIAEPALLIGIEVDGPSHSSKERREQDAKKDAFLSRLGWSILRFSNHQVMDDLPGCVRTVSSTISRLRGITTISQMAS
jgi:hypothetical protein